MFYLDQTPEEKIERFKKFRISDIDEDRFESHTKRASIRRLKEKETELCNGYNFGLPYFLLRENHIEKVGVKRLSRDLGISDKSLNFIKQRYGFSWLDGVEIFKRVFEDPEKRKRRSEISKGLWEDKNYVEKVKKKRDDFNSSSEGKIIRSNASKMVWDNPKTREAHAKRLEKRWKDPEERRKASERMKERWRKKKKAQLQAAE
jgi:hypothetical protein